MDPQMQAIFVLGAQRSGTTWVSNLLSGHSRVACIESEDHHGIHESIFFSHFMSEFGDLSIACNWERFADAFGKCDYFALGKLSSNWIQENRTRHYDIFFAAYMDAIAKQEQATHWIEKSPHHSLMANQLNEFYPDARFVCILRSPKDIVRSAARRYPKELSGLKRMQKIVKSLAYVALIQRCLRKFSEGKKNAIVLNYEDLHTDTDKVVRSICAFVELDFEESMLTQRFKPNTSFQNTVDRDRMLSAADNILLSICWPLLAVVPLPLLQYLRGKGAATGIVWPDWCWKINQRPDLSS